MAEIDGPDRPPRGSLAPVLAGAVILALLVAGIVAVVVLRGTASDPAGLAPVAPSPFGAGDEVEPGPARAWFSADGTKLAVISAGAVGLAQEGGVRLLTDRGGNVVDVAWFSAGTALLVAEGPVPTGGLVVLATSGEVRGTIPLDPPITFGSGHGMSVAPGGRRAVVTAVERDPFGVESTRLVEVDLTTGKSVPLDTGPGSAMHPHHLDAARLAFTRVTGDGREAVVATLGSSGGEVSLGEGEVRGIVGAGEAVVVQRDRALRVVPPTGGDARTVADGVGGRVVAVHPSGTSVVVAERRGDAVVLRRIAVDGGGST